MIDYFTLIGVPLRLDFSCCVYQLPIVDTFHQHFPRGLWVEGIIYAMAVLPTRILSILLCGVKSVARAPFSVSVIRACFGFRASDFVFCHSIHAHLYG